MLDADCVVEFLLNSDRHQFINLGFTYFLIYKNMLPTSTCILLSLGFNDLHKAWYGYIPGSPFRIHDTRSHCTLNLSMDCSVFLKIGLLLKQRWRTSYLFLDDHCFLYTCLRQNYYWQTSHRDDKPWALDQGRWKGFGTGKLSTASVAWLCRYTSVDPAAFLPYSKSASLPC
jgi:hypothetical protein